MHSLCHQRCHSMYCLVLVCIRVLGGGRTGRERGCNPPKSNRCVRCKISDQELIFVQLHTFLVETPVPSHIYPPQLRRRNSQNPKSEKLARNGLHLLSTSNGRSLLFGMGCINPRPPACSFISFHCQLVQHMASTQIFVEICTPPQTPKTESCDLAGTQTANTSTLCIPTPKHASSQNIRSQKGNPHDFSCRLLVINRT